MASLLDSKVVATELISRPQTISAPRYRYMKVYPTTGAGDITIPFGGRPTVQFEIPTQAFNYSKSYICGTITATRPSEDFVQWVYKDSVAWCNRASFKTRGGATLFDLDYVNNYTKIVNRMETLTDEVVTADSSDVLYASRDPPRYGILGYEYKLPADFAVTNSENKEVKGATFFSSEGLVVSNAELPPRPTGGHVDHPGVEAVYCDAGSEVYDGSGDVDEDGNPKVNTTGQKTYHFRIPLSKLVPNSVFSRRSDLKLPEIAILTLSLGPGTKISWEGSDLYNPTSGAVACKTPTMLKNFFLHMAKQDDPIFETMFDERLRSGFAVPINVPIHSMHRISTPSTSQNVSVTYNSGYGHRLVRIYHSVFTQEDFANTAYDNSCEDHTPKIRRYHVKLQGSRTTDEDLVLEVGDSIDPSGLSAYLYHKDLLEGTSVTTSNIWKANFVHIEDVARIGGPKRWKELGFRKDDADIGVPLDQDYKFEFVATTQNQPYDHYTFAIVQRILKVDGSTVVVE